MSGEMVSHLPLLFCEPMMPKLAPHLILTTPRLSLRAPCPADALPMAAMAGDWDVASMTGQLPYPYTLTNAHCFIADLPKGDPLRQAFAITLNGDLIGITGHTACDPASASIGYWIGKSYWHRGFATEAAGALVRHCFETQKFQHLTCAHFEENTASARVIAKLGFQPLGSATCWCEATQSERPSKTYTLTIESYRANTLLGARS
jgi:[ribosomal protein S5]-alanine N-acetyltransferase